MSAEPKKLAIGLDFGTSNSAIAVVEMKGDSRPAPLSLFNIDPSGDDARLFRSVLFFPQYSMQTLGGAEAIAHYISEGEGRFLQSVKSFLHMATFDKTQIRGRLWFIEDLVACMLRMMRERLEKATGGKIVHAVFGRPAVFSPDPELDALAQTRLQTAAVRAGFPEPSFVIEPIAAALSYEAQLDKEELVLVADFGAGTSDFTLMRLGPTRQHKANRSEDVVASGGVRIGGDNFDAAIVEHRLMSQFGADATYSIMGQRMPLPRWMTRKVLAWHELSLLREKEVMAFLYRALDTADDADAIRNLIQLAEDNLAYHLYRAVEGTKRALSHNDTAPLQFSASDIVIDQTVTRSDFETWTLPLRQGLMQTVSDVLERAGNIEPDAVFLTGGTSKIPSVRQDFIERFGADRLRDGDALASVVSGLGHAAAAKVRDNNLCAV